MVRGNNPDEGATNGSDGGEALKGCAYRTAESVPKPGLLPIVSPSSTVLVLGSFPSARARAEGAYYANPRNNFWPIIEELFGIERTLPYPVRVRLLVDRGVALWDMVASCIQEGSMDSTLSEPTLNDIPGFLAVHPAIRLVAANGRTAERFLKRSLGTGGPPFGVALAFLPSTSPANTRGSFEMKVEQWRVIRDSALPPVSGESDDPQCIGRFDPFR